LVRVQTQGGLCGEDKGGNKGKTLQGGWGEDIFRVGKGRETGLIIKKKGAGVLSIGDREGP